MAKHAPVAGVYLVAGPNGVYVGESDHCFRRNRQNTLLGIQWGIVREMPEATHLERVRAERMVADHWQARGFTVVSENTTFAVSQVRKRANPRGSRTFSAEHRAKLSAALTGKRASTETRAKLSRAHRGMKASATTRQKMSVAALGNTNARGGAASYAEIALGL